MKVAIFEIHNFERKILNDTNSEFLHELNFLELRLTERSAALAKDHECVKEVKKRKAYCFVDMPRKFLKKIIYLKQDFIKPNLVEFQSLVEN